jgi:hypothetical protein
VGKFNAHPLLPPPQIEELEIQISKTNTYYIKVDKIVGGKSINSSTTENMYC